MSNLSENKRIAKNTLLLYIRMFLLIIIQLYTVPIILHELGVEDYGIYNVVGGIVTMFSFISGSFVSGCQRFVAFEIGKGNTENLKKIFDSMVTIFLFFALAMGILLEVGGCWFLNYQMIIPTERLIAANWVLQLSILAFLINLVSIPYNAIVIAHERMSLYAYVSILECFFKLITAASLQYFMADKLIMYAIFMCLISIAVRIIYQLYCKRNFFECRHYHFSLRTYMGKSLLFFSGWNLIGSLATILKKQGLNIVMNLFFGAVLNAAHALALQISGLLEQFMSNIYVATRPQITKLYASGRISEMWSLVSGSNKLVFYLLMLLAIPSMIEMETILNLWLHEVPNYTVPIARLMIISLLVEILVGQLIAVCQACNRIKELQIYSSTIILLNVPVSYLGLKIYPDLYLLPYLNQILFSSLFVISVLYVTHKVLHLNLRIFLWQFALRCILVFLLVYVAVSFLSSRFEPTFGRIVFSGVLTACSSFFVIYFIGLTADERRRCIVQYKKYIHKNKI